MRERPTPRTVTEALFGRSVAVAYGTLTLLYLLQFVRIRPVQIPAYLLIVAYDIVEGTFPFLTPYYPVGFPLFLYVLAVGSAAAVRLRHRDDGAAGWRPAVGGVCLVFGLLSAVYGAFVGGPLASPADNPTPLAILATTATVFLVGAWWLLRADGGG